MYSTHRTAPGKSLDTNKYIHILWCHDSRGIHVACEPSEPGYYHASETRASARARAREFACVIQQNQQSERIEWSSRCAAAAAAGAIAVGASGEGNTSTSISAALIAGALFKCHSFTEPD